MPVSREVNTQKNFVVWSGGFSGGLFNSIDGSLIPDNSLHDMSNLHVDHFGVLHSVTQPTEHTDLYYSGGSGPILAIMSSREGLWANRNGVLYRHEPFQATTAYAVDYWTSQVATSPANISASSPTCYVNSDGLWIAGVNITEALFDFPLLDHKYSSTICEFEGRIWLNTVSDDASHEATILRGSDLTNPTLEETWRGPVDPVDGTTMTLANALIFVKFQQAIRYLIPMNGSLLIFCDDGIYALNSFFDGTKRLLYSGAVLPSWETNPIIHIYSDGQAAYYVSTNKFYAFNGTPQCISDRLSLPVAASWSVGESDGRFWFLVSEDALPNGTSVNYLYAIDKTAGAWEKYDIQMTAKNGSTYDTPTSIMGGEDKQFNVNGDRLYLGTSLGKVFILSPTATGTPLAWSFTTKTYTPSFDAYSRFVHFKIRYVGQAATSPVTIKQYVCRDGTPTLVQTNTSLDMAGSGFYQKDVECYAQLGEGVYFVVSGTGTAEIADVGVEFTTKSGGDVNA
jgi:hypothetical protein